MRRVALVFALALTFLSPMPAVGANHVRAPNTMFKGAELYSWKDNDGNWRYSLLPGTNRKKNRNEIISDRTMIKSVALLKERIAMLAVGEQVFWYNSDASGFSFPDSMVVADIVAYAKTAKVSLHMPE